MVLKWYAITHWNEISFNWYFTTVVIVVLCCLSAAWLEPKPELYYLLLQ